MNQAAVVPEQWPYMSFGVYAGSVCMNMFSHNNNDTYYAAASFHVVLVYCQNVSVWTNAYYNHFVCCIRNHNIHINILGHFSASFSQSFFLYIWTTHFSPKSFWEFIIKNLCSHFLRDFFGIHCVCITTQKTRFFYKEKFPLFKNGHFIFVLFFRARPFLFLIFILCGI